MKKEEREKYLDDVLRYAIFSGQSVNSAIREISRVVRKAEKSLQLKKAN